MIYLGKLWGDFDDEHKKFYISKIEKAISKLKKEGLAISTIAANFLQENIQDIVSSEIEDIHRVLDFYERKYLSEKLRRKMAEKISKHISYENFSKKVDGKRNLCYEMCLKFSNVLKIKCCPFCQINSVLSKGDAENYNYRSDLDHFFCKTKYPFLSISIWNLIPICKDCNTTFKGSKNFFSEKHQNPMFDEEEVEFDFMGSILNSVDVQSSLINIRVSLDSVLIKNSLNTFDLIHRYENLAMSFLLERLTFYSTYKNCVDSGKYEGFNSNILEDLFIGASREEYKKNQFGKLKLDFDNFLIKINN